MIKILEWSTKDGNKMKLKNSPVSLGVDMLLISCSEDEKLKIFKQLGDELEPGILPLKVCSECCFVYSQKFNECPECGGTECD